MSHNATAGATADATAEHARQISERQQLPGAAYRPLGRTGLTTSAVGFGAYRIDAQETTHGDALRHALRRGVNLIDTSSNYSDGGSETLIGRVLSEAGKDDEEVRARTIVVSKGGYVQGQNMKLAQEAAEAGNPFPEMVEYDPTCWHCIHPAFLAQQLERSLARLGLETIDVYLLHNPEYFLSDWAKHNPGGDPAPAREEFYRRIGEAFAYLEQCVQDGKIQWYGVSSNTFGLPAEEPGFVSLERLIALGAAAARQVRGDGAASGFGVVQCPLNLLEGGPLLQANQEQGGTFLELAAAEELAVLVNRPLNALREGRLVRLADVPVPRPNVEEEIGVALDALLAEEQTFAGLFRPSVASDLPEDAGPHTPFEWSAAVRGSYPNLQTREQWNNALEGQIYPHLQASARFVRQRLMDERQRKDFQVWFPQYCRKLETAAGLITEWLGKAEHEQARGLHDRLEPLLGPSLRGLPLSQKALLALLALPGVSCVLNGMRRPTYVEDSTGAPALPPLETGAGVAILRAFSQHGN